MFRLVLRAHYRWLKLQIYLRYFENTLFQRIFLGHLKKIGYMSCTFINITTLFSAIENRM